MGFPEIKEMSSDSGMLVVICGRSGVGKDETARNFMDRMGMVYSKVVTCATRKPELRNGEMEVNGKHYHFVSTEELFSMHAKGELVEVPVQTGKEGDYKATPKSEFVDVLQGRKKVWLVDLTLAVKIADGDYFSEQFEPDVARQLKERTALVYIDADQNTLDSRRMKRDGKGYDPNRYESRDHQEIKLIQQHGHKFTMKLDNPDDRQEETVLKLVDFISNFIK